MHRYVKPFTPTFNDDETSGCKENPESMEEDYASDKADDDESNIEDKAEMDDSDDDVSEEEDADEEEADSDGPWRLLVEEAFERCETEFDGRVTKYMSRQGKDEGDARKRVCDDVTNLQKSVGARFR